MNNFPTLISRIYNNYTVNMTSCPRCGKEAKATGKTWKFGLFDGKGFYCNNCKKPFSAFYKKGVLSHTVPKR